MCVAMSSGKRRSDDLQYTLTIADTIEIRISHRTDGHMPSDLGWMTKHINC